MFQVVSSYQRSVLRPWAWIHMLHFRVWKQFNIQTRWCKNTHKSNLSPQKWMMNVMNDSILEAACNPDLYDVRSPSCFYIQQIWYHSISLSLNSFNFSGLSFVMLIDWIQQKTKGSFSESNSACDYKVYKVLFWVHGCRWDSQQDTQGELCYGLGSELIHLLGWNVCQWL